jgi:hypothetical protein
MFFKIQGVDQRTGSAREALIDAPSEQDAIRRAAEEGIVVPGFEAVAKEVRAANAERQRALLASAAAALKDYSCPRCGSKKIIPDVPLTVSVSVAVGGQLGIGGGGGEVEVTVCGAPGAWIFKDRASGHLSGRICGECGHVDLYASNSKGLYGKYEKSQQS